MSFARIGRPEIFTDASLDHQRLVATTSTLPTQRSSSCAQWTLRTVACRKRILLTLFSRRIAERIRVRPEPPPQLVYRY